MVLERGLGCTMVKQAKKTHLRRRKPRVGESRSPLPVLQGREEDFALIDHLLDRIDQGGWTLVINGESGIGKSALLAAAKNRAHECGFLVLGMTGVLAEVHLPFAGLEQALRPLLKRVKGVNRQTKRTPRIASPADVTLMAPLPMTI
jgi:hypothetical protein